MTRTRGNGARRGLACVLPILLGAASLPAQPSRRAEQSEADRAIAEGRLSDAEALLYAASARSPRDPAARGALGAFLAARGSLKVGAVLLEEARQFGADARVINARLARVFTWAGAWEQLSALGAALPEPESARARWLATHAATRGGPDSTSIPLEPDDVFGLGRIAIGVAGTTLQADIDPNAEGLVLPNAADVTEHLQRFGTQGETGFAVAARMTIGAAVLTNVPVRLESGARARVGLDVLAPLRPMFDLAARRLTLLPATAGAAGGEQVPFLLGFPGVRIVPRAGEPPVALESPAGRAAVRRTRWTFDLRRGALVLR
ncbi:MAG: tetratricopeptide repeat protein [Gemmatimonadales bacterium]